MVEPAVAPVLELDPMEQRILGSLMEKQRTVPASYPLTFTALRTACNQTSSRDPVVDYDLAAVEQCVRSLRARELVRVVVGDRGSRVLRCHQLLAARLDLAADERALITVLLLRGAQAPGELKTRTERLHPFADRTEVEDCLRRLAGRTVPMVRQLAKQPGQHDRRWIHLLGPVAAVPATAPDPAVAVDRDTVLVYGAPARDARVVAAYDAAAEAYAERFADELTRLPFDDWLLARLVELAGPEPVADVGCGPGHITRRLADAGADVRGFDLSAEMVQQARRLHPDIHVEVGDLTRMLRPPTASAWGAVVAWYSLIHLAGSELPAAIAGLARVLRPGGWLLLAVHAGTEVVHLDSLLGQPVDLDVVLHDPAEVRQAIRGAGLQVAEWYQRGAIPGEESASDRFYLLARREA